MLNNKALAVILSILTCCTGISCQPVNRMIELGTHSLHAVVNGTGSPALVIDGGIGARCDEYLELQERLASATTVITYDRAGYGSSKAGPLPRDSRREVDELRSVLAKLNIIPPFILVGHSLGGLNVQVFADLYPEEVAGMVLLDPPPLPFITGKEYMELASMADRMTGEWQGIAENGMDSEDEEEKSNALFFGMIASEHREMFGRSALQVSSISSFDSIPLVVIASGVPNQAFGDDAESYQLFWASESKAIAARSSRGKFVFAERSGHNLHQDAEDIVADEILTLLRSIRNNGH